MFRLFTTVIFSLFLAIPAHAFLLERNITSTTPVTIDWANWDTSYSSAGGFLFTDLGLSGPVTVDPVVGSSTDIVMMNRYREDGNEARYISKLRRSGMSVSEVGRTALSIGNEGIQSNIVSLSSDTAVGFFMATGVMNMFLFDTSVDTPTETAVDDFTAEMTSTAGLNGYASLKRRNDTQAVLWYPEDNVRYARLVYTSGGNLTYSSATEAPRISSEDGAKVGDLDIIDENSFIAFTVAAAYYFTIDGSGNITLVDSQFLRGATSAYTTTQGAVNIRPNKWVLLSTIGTGSTGDVYCTVISLSGSTLSRTFNAEVAANTDLWPNGPEGKSTLAETGVAFFSTVNSTVDPTQVNLYKVLVDESDTCTLETGVASVSGDHSTVDMATDRYMVTFAQDPNATPEDSISYKVIDGATP